MRRKQQKIKQHNLLEQLSWDGMQFTARENQQMTLVGEQSKN